MKEIEKKIRDMQKDGIEYVSLNDLLHWIDNIKRNKRVARAERLEGKRGY